MFSYGVWLMEVFDMDCIRINRPIECLEGIPKGFKYWTEIRDIILRG